MNHCVLSVEVVQEPQLRYTSDTQTPIAEMLVQIPGLRDSDPPAQIRLIGWGGLAQEVQAQYHVGDRLLVEGRLSMNTVDRPEGFKEKRAELVAQRVYRWGADQASAGTPDEASATYTAAPTTAPVAPSPAPAPLPQDDTPDYDDIPF